MFSHDPDRHGFFRGPGGKSRSGDGLEHGHRSCLGRGIADGSTGGFTRVWATKSDRCSEGPSGCQRTCKVHHRGVWTSQKPDDCLLLRPVCDDQRRASLVGLQHQAQASSNDRTGQRPGRARRGAIGCWAQRVPLHQSFPSLCRWWAGRVVDGPSHPRDGKLGSRRGVINQESERSNVRCPQSSEQQEAATRDLRVLLGIAEQNTWLRAPAQSRIDLRCPVLVEPRGSPGGSPPALSISEKGGAAAGVRSSIGPGRTGSGRKSLSF